MPTPLPQQYQYVIVDAEHLLIPPTPPNENYDWGEIVDISVVRKDQKGKKVKIYCLHQGQLDLIRSEAKYTFAFAGSGSGKTILISLWLLKEMQKLKKLKRNPRAIVVSPTADIQYRSRLMERVREAFDGSYLQGEWVAGRKSYKVGGGGEILFATVDQSDYTKISGGDYDLGAGDEVYLLSQEVYEEMRRRVGRVNGRLLMVTTPTGNSWIKGILERFKDGDKDIYCRQFGSALNPTYSKQFLAEEKERLGEAKYGRMYLGEFTSSESLIYPYCLDSSDKLYPIIQGNPYNSLPSPPLRWFGGIDWGYRDETSIVMIAECEDGDMYVVDEIYGANIKTDELKMRALAMIDKWALRVGSGVSEHIEGGRFGCFWADTSRPETIEHFRGSGINVRNKKITDVMARISSSDKWFRTGHLKVFSCCTNLIDDLQNQEWDTDRRGGLRDYPKHEHSHCTDALTYAISSQKYGIEPTVLLRSNLSEKIEMEKVTRFKLDDPSILQKKEEEEMKQRQMREYERAWGDRGWNVFGTV